MLKQLQPFNIDLLFLEPPTLKMLGQIKVLDIFDTTKNFHNDGLFSTTIFGKQGTDQRQKNFGYISLNTEIFHPLLAKTLFKLKSLYQDIASGAEYAIFDTNIKDFVKADPTNGSTGYSFFLKHVKYIKFEERQSARRSDAIALMDKYRDNLTLKHFLVMPAGLRDYMVDAQGKPSEDEINNMYRKVLALSNIMSSSVGSINPEFLDNTRYRLQLALIEIYDYVVNILEGKNGLVLGKWASRKIFDSTRNVITSWVPDSDTLFGPKSVRGDQTVIGLHQYLRNIFPLATKLVRETYLSKVFPGANSPAVLVNKDTLQKELVQIDPSTYSDWMSYNGFESTLARFAEEDQRHDYLETDDHWFALMYKGKDGTFKIFQDIRDLPDGFDKKLVTPLTFAELLYCSVFRDSDTIPTFNTRYPVAGYGGIYPSYLYLKSTIKSEIRYELGDDWTKIEGQKPANEFPIYKEPFFNSISVSNVALARLGAD